MHVQLIAAVFVSKTNWEDIKKQYLAEYSETGVGIKAFCIRNGLTYSTARKYLNNRLLDSLSGDIEHKTEQNTSEQLNKNKNRTRTPKSAKPKSNDPAKQSRSSHGGKRAGAGAKKDNKNAYVHGLMTKAFGDVVKYSHQADDDFKLEVHRCASIQALQCNVKYKEDLDELLNEIGDRESPVPSETEIDKIESLEKRIDSTMNQVCFHVGKLEYLESQMTNRGYTRKATSKVEAQIKHTYTDTRLKSKSILLAEANTDKAKALTQLAKHDLTLKQRTELGDDDDLGETLENIQSAGDDEIIKRFEQNGGELNIDD